MEKDAPQVVRDLIPEDALEHTKVGKAGFNAENITSKVRLATLLPPLYLLKMQNKCHAMAAAGELPTHGWGATFCLSYMKMGPLWLPDTRCRRTSTEMANGVAVVFDVRVSGHAHNAADHPFAQMRAGNTDDGEVPALVSDDDDDTTTIEWK